MYVLVTVAGDKALTLTVHNFVKLPVDSKIYTITGGVIQGFSSAFLQASIDEDSARSYLNTNCGFAKDSEFCMDLHDQKITGEQYAFSRLNTSITGSANANNILALFTKLDFRNTQWQWNTSGHSGYRTFGGTNTSNNCQFINTKIIDLQSANFAVANDVPSAASSFSAAYTFAYATFPQLETLNLTGAVFARANISASNFYTAYHTFSYATFSKLETLNLTGAVFAIANMSSATTHVLYIAAYTFNYATFSQLKTLNLAGAVFATAGMSINGYIYTCHYTFTHCDFSSLETLNLSGATFAVTSMLTRNSGSGSSVLITAYYTFSFATFHTLKSLNLTGAAFVAADMTSNGSLGAEINVYTANYTFFSATFSSLETLNLAGAVFAAPNMTDAYGSLNTANCTFASCVFSSLRFLNLAGAVFATAGMRSSGSSTNYTGRYAFQSSNLSKLETLNLGDCQIGGDNTGINTINNNCFNTITPNADWSSTKLQLSADVESYWMSPGDGKNALDSWFVDGYWTF